jgi:hypothetical protein
MPDHLTERTWTFYYDHACLKWDFHRRAPRTQRKHFALAGDTAKQKGFRPFKASLIIGCHSQQVVSIFFPKGWSF